MPDSISAVIKVDGLDELHEKIKRANQLITELKVIMDEINKSPLTASIERN